MAEYPIELSIYMTGLLLLAPVRAGEGDEGPVEEVQVLVPDARRSPLVPLPDGTETPIERHIPVVQFNWQDLVNRDRRPFRKFYDLDQASKGLWILDKDVLKIDGVSSVGRIRFEPIRNGAQLPTPSDREYTGWIAEGAGRVESTLLTPAGSQRWPDGVAPKDEPLVAVLRLPRGSLRPAAFSAQQGQYILFDNPRDSSRRAIASVVEYRATVQDKSVRLVAQKFDGAEGETLELKPSRDAQGRTRRIEIFLLNREWDAILKQLPSRLVQVDELNPEYFLLMSLLDSGEGSNNKNALDLEAREFRKANPAVEILPNPFPCDDPVMRMLYFPDPGGQNGAGATCSPVTG